MAQLDFNGTWDDSWSVLNDIFTRGDIKAYFDAGPHDEPAAQPSTSLTPELKDMLRTGRPRLFLFGSFSTHPPLFWQQDQGVNAGKYFLSDSGGGPLISFMIATEREQPDGRLFLVGGTLWTQPRYQLEPDRWERPSQALKDAYADISKRVKKHLVRYQGHWLAPKALSLLQAGRAQFPTPAPPLPPLDTATLTVE